MFLIIFFLSTFYFRLLSVKAVKIELVEKKPNFEFYILTGRFKGVKQWEKPYRDGQKVAAAVNERFYLQHYTENTFGTFITGRLIGGGRLIRVRL